MQNGNEKSVGTVIGESLRPAQPDILGALYASRRELDAEIAEEEERLRDLTARHHEMSENIARIEGRTRAAEWHRAEVATRCERTPEAAQAAKDAYVRMCAERHLQRGTVPASDDYASSEVEAEMDRQRAEVRQ